MSPVHRILNPCDLWNDYQNRDSFGSRGKAIHVPVASVCSGCIGLARERFESRGQLRRSGHLVGARADDDGIEVCWPAISDVVCARHRVLQRGVCGAGDAR